MTALSINPIVASYPLDPEHIVVRLAEPLERFENAGFSLLRRLEVVETTVDDRDPQRVVLSVAPMTSVPVVVDHVVMRTGRRTFVGPPFAHGTLTALELKVPNFESRFPFTSTLLTVNVTVACCTGCDGGVHDRGLVVLNDHLGGGWSGIWVRTAQQIEGPYPRWQRMVFAGGVIEDRGSTEVVDQGWMEISKGDEEGHHPPPPLPVSTADIPAEHTESLRARSLDGCWVELSNLTVETAERVEPREWESGRLPYTEIVVHDDSGARSAAYVFQEQRDALRIDTRISRLRGFVHAEAPGQYVLLTDKPEDIEL